MCGRFTQTAEKGIGEAFAPPVLPDAWRRRPPTSWIMSSPGCRCANGWCRFPSCYCDCLRAGDGLLVETFETDYFTAYTVPEPGS